MGTIRNKFRPHIISQKEIWQRAVPTQPALRGMFWVDAYVAITPAHVRRPWSTFKQAYYFFDFGQFSKYSALATTDTALRAGWIGLSHPSIRGWPIRSWSSVWLQEQRNVFYCKIGQSRVIRGSSLETAQCGIYNMISANTWLDIRISHRNWRPPWADAWKFTIIESKLVMFRKS